MKIVQCITDSQSSLHLTWCSSSTFVEGERAQKWSRLQGTGQWLWETLWAVPIFKTFAISE